MKSILSPYDDINFNNYLLQYVKKRLSYKCKVFAKDDKEHKYFLDKNFNFVFRGILFLPKLYV